MYPPPSTKRWSTLVHARPMPHGAHTLTWDGVDREGIPQTPESCKWKINAPRSSASDTTVMANGFHAFGMTGKGTFGSDSVSPWHRP